MSNTTHHVTVRMARGYEFVSEFHDVVDAPSILCDEPPPLGSGRSPNAVDLLTAAVGNCLSASLAFCLRKSRVEPERVTAHVTTHLVRTEKGRFRVGGIDVELIPQVNEADVDRLARCETLFEDFCTVAESVRRGIPVNVSVKAPVHEAQLLSR
jgi:organic hydroperoxide reductase OsmC/OhrA